MVDATDTPIGQMEKMQAHREAQLHRAFSIFIFNSNNELLIHQRALEKYHSGGLWTNTCCSHPRPGEPTIEAAHRRLHEEMGMNCELRPLLEFTYKAKLDKGLTEHEYDHVFIGHTDSTSIPNPEEVAAIKYVALDELSRQIAEHPDLFTVWFKVIFDRVRTHIASNN